MTEKPQKAMKFCPACQELKVLRFFSPRDGRCDFCVAYDLKEERSGSKTTHYQRKVDEPRPGDGEGPPTYRSMSEREIKSQLRGRRFD